VDRSGRLQPCAFPILPSPHEVIEDSGLTFSRVVGPFPPARSAASVTGDHDTEDESSTTVSSSFQDTDITEPEKYMTTDDILNNNEPFVAAAEATSTVTPSSARQEVNEVCHDALPPPDLKHQISASDDTDPEESPKPSYLDAFVGLTSRSCLPTAGLCHESA
jgi:hypothetical protein